MKISFNDIKKICERYTHKDLYFNKNIPARKLKNASEKFKIPETSEVIALYDNTLFGSCKEGIAICSDGIHFSKLYQKAYTFLWKDIISIDVNYKNKTVMLNKYYCIDKFLSDFEVLAELFLEIRDYLNLEEVLKLNNIKNSGNKDFLTKGILNICEKYICDKLYFKNSISGDKLEKIKLDLKIPNKANIITVYDFKTGFAICYNGIYLINSKSINLISWKDLITVDIDFAEAAVVLNKCQYMYCNRSDFKVISDLFLEINNYINEIYISQKPSEKKSYELNKTKQKNKKKNKNESKFKVNENKINIIENDQDENKLVNINNASIDQLISLPFFTSERAERVLSERGNDVIFNSIDDIIPVLRLKPHEAEKLRLYLSFETNRFKKNVTKNDFSKKKEETNDNTINTPLKGRIIDY